MPSIEETHNASPEDHEKMKQEAYRGMISNAITLAGVKIATLVAIRLIQKRMKMNVAKRFNSNL